ncbi:MAG: protein-tyrosine-phosphatase [Bacteroidia bacterium]|nr:protein-tyrosine-phosphatase [Bacteroidia bacterium]
MYPSLKTYIEQLEPEVRAIPEQRIELLEKIVSYCKGKIQAGLPCELNFICTHNSRRSHMGQIWARTMAVHHGVMGVETYSGGTEATAFNPNAIKAIRAAGFDIEVLAEGVNPQYLVRNDNNDKGSEAWSKVFSDPSNPNKDFGAIMTCQEADEACPFVPGAELRVALSYDDPKAFDGTDLQDAKYQERSRQIASEMYWVFEKVKKELV